MTSKKELWNLIQSSEILISPAIYDGITAKVVENVGFKTAMMGGGAVSNTLLAKPDFGFLGLTDMEQHVQKISNEVELAIQVDADTGYGNAINVSHTVSSLEKAGAAMIMIEDQVFPKRCGHFEGKEVVPAKEMVSKVKAAVDARDDPATLVIARTDAAGPLGVDEAIARLNMYVDHGADVVLADALLSKDDIRRVSREANAPLKVNMGFGLRERPTTPLMTPHELEELGVSIVSYGRLTRGAAVKGMQKAFQELLEQKGKSAVNERPDLVVGQEEYTKLMGLPELKDQEQRYAPNR